MDIDKRYGVLKGPYNQSSAKKRVEALFLDNIGKIITRDQIINVCGKNPNTGANYENWHQRLSELRTDDGYTILSKRDTPDLGVSEYKMIDSTKREKINKRVSPTPHVWKEVLRRANNCCEWNEGGQYCNLKNGDVDPIGGGKVNLTADHINPHSLGSVVDSSDPDQWRALCGRHQIMKKNFWNSSTGKLNTEAIIQAASIQEKERAYKFLKEYFKDDNKF